MGSVAGNNAKRLLGNEFDAAPVFSCVDTWDAEPSRHKLGSKQLRLAWNSGTSTAVRKSMGFGAPSALTRALRKLEAYLGTNASGTQLSMPLVPGRAALLDNWRVLHGRESFSATSLRRMAHADLAEHSLRERWRELCKGEL